MTAVFSEDRLFRYWIERDVQFEGITCGLIGVNPSDADERRNDPTIRKDIGFAKVNGWRRIIKGNAFALVSKEVTGLATAADPVGPMNDGYIDRLVEEAELLVPCWGDRKKIPARLRPRLDAVMERLLASGKPVMAFGLTRGGDPMHPLMLGYDTKLGFVRTGREASTHA